MGKSIRKPITADDIFAGVKGVEDAFGQTTTKETSRQGHFNAHDYEYLDNASYYDDPRGLAAVNIQKQGLDNLISRTSKQFGANLASSFGQGLANTFDLFSLAKSIKGAVEGTHDDFESSLFGLTTREMQEWANGVAERNKIYEQKEGSVNLADPGWWGKQIASSGTGIGMGFEALATTIGIEAATGGMGTAAALAKLANLGKRIVQGARGGQVLTEALSAAKGLRSAATLYGTVSRASESRMEAMQSYDDIYNELGTEKNQDGTEKYTIDERKRLAAEGAKRTMAYNLALLPLDILGYRTMVFNPVSGTATGLLERGLSKIGNKFLRGAVQQGINTSLEGLEEGGQFIGSQEGKHYARVLGGMDDGSTFGERFGKNVKEDEFWNSVAGGVIGSPVIGGAMKLTNRVMNGNKQQRLEQVHADFIKNVGQMDETYSKRIKQLETEGRSKEASVLRRQFAANKAVSALHLDAMTDKDSAFDSHLNFISATLGEINEGKKDALGDLGFPNPSDEQIQVIKKEFEDYQKDAIEMKNIYDSLKDVHNKNFLPEITFDHFQLNTLIKEKADLQQKMVLTGMQYGTLSPVGLGLHQTKYKIEALGREKTRLVNKLATLTNEDERADIQSQLENTNTKLQEAKTGRDTASNDPEYKDKALDTEISNALLPDSSYRNAVYFNERLDNEISLKRKEIAKWNDPEFVAKKNKEAIAKAKTPAQVEATKENLDKNGQSTQETENAIQEKQTELAAQDAAQALRANEASLNTSTSIPGNANLFDDEESVNALNQIITDSSLKPTDKEEPVGDKPIELLFSPAEFDPSKSSDEANERIRASVEGLLNKLPENASFEDLVRNVAKVKGEGIADEIFKALSYGWEANGNPAVDYDAVYNKVFNSYDALIEDIQSSIKTDTQLKAANNKIEKEELSHQEQPQGFDDNNQPIYKYMGRVTNESAPKFAFLSRISELNTSKNEEDKTVIEHEYTADELNAGDYVDSLPLLDPDKYNEDTELQIRVPPNFMDIKIPVYNGDGTKGKSVTFGQYVAQHNLSPDSQEYKDKLPMIMYGNQEKGVAFVHDIGWYHPLRFNQDHKDDMKNAIEHTRAIRSAVIGNNGKADIVITGKRQTTFAGLKSEPTTLREANPDSKISVALSTDSLSDSKGKDGTIFPNNDSVLTNVAPFKVGEVLDVRRFGTKEGKQTYIALKVTKPKLDDTSKSSVLLAINIYAHRSNPDPSIREKHNQLAKQIQDIMGIDILNPQGLEKYLKHFISTFNTEKAKSNEDVEAQAKAKLPLGTPYIAFIAGGNIVFGKAGEAAYVSSQGKKVGSYFINPNTEKPSPISLQALRKSGIMDWYEQNVNLDNLKANKPVAVITKELNVETAAPSYNDYLLDRLKSDIKSYNIGTKEKPNYVTNVQPIITYDLKDAKTTNLPTNVEITKEIKQEVRGEIIEEGKKEVPHTVTQLEQEALDRARALLGDNFQFGVGENLFSPAILDDEQRDAVTKDILKIAGLTPDQQFQVVDFMYNQIVPMIKPGTSVPRAQVNKAVDEALDAVLKPLKQLYKDEIARNVKDIAQFPSLAKSSLPDVNASLELQISKIDAIYKELDTFKDLVKIRLDKFTGITEAKDKLDADPALEALAIEDNPNPAERDFWTDVLTESPDNKLSYRMRRFFGQIRQYDPKTKQPIKGFFGLPTYVGADTVTRTIMVSLADVPSDFDSMLAKLESRKEAIPWMAEAIDRLNKADNQEKQQFVTLMSNHSLQMKFTMISYNRKAKSWTTKVYNTNQSGVASAIKDNWEDNLVNSQLILGNPDGTYSINLERAKYLINTYNDWVGEEQYLIQNTKSLEEPRTKIKPNNPVQFTPDAALLAELNTNLKSGGRVLFNLKGQKYQIEKQDGKYMASFVNTSGANKEGIQNWLSEFGIELSDGALEELMTVGLMHNKEVRDFKALFQPGTDTNGLFGILANELKVIVAKGGTTLDEEGNSPLNNTVIKSLANLEAKYNNEVTPFGFRDGGKSIFALTAPKFITDRVRDLKSPKDEVRKQLESVSFSKGSFWLRLLSDASFQGRFAVSHMGLTAFKELGKKVYRDNSLAKLSDLDHELTKLGMFWDTTQGEVRYNGLQNYPDTTIGIRMATMFSPTMSDKHMMTMLNTAVLDLQNKDLNNGDGLSDEVVKVLYDQLVRPELSRMIKHAQLGGKTNIKNYDKGAGMFLFMPSLNDIEFSNGLTLRGAIKNAPNDFTLERVESSKTVVDAINKEIRAYVDALVKQKLEVWDNNGLTTRDANGNILGEIKYLDRKYLDRNFRGNNNAKIKMAAMDFVVNSLVANANSFMTMIGDPALYYKSDKTNPLLAAKETFVNVGKRLAAQIAPGTPIANSEHEKYIQIFLNDRTSVAQNIEYLEKLYGKDVVAAYRDIEASDAQEYTTWQEHLDILAKLGKTPDSEVDVTAEEIQEARELFASDSKAPLTERQKEIMGKVLQPLKPVYTGQIFDAAQDVMRTMYIKSSSFPLIPQLTRGLEIDKLRLAMEKIEKPVSKGGKGMPVRASYQSANKVGALNTPVNIWDANGNITEGALNDLSNNYLVLDRKNFRIQQEVPFKSAKEGDDKITLGTQIMKLLFGDEMMNFDGFEYNGKSYKGSDLHRIYNDLFIDLVGEKRQQLFDELKLDKDGLPIDTAKSMAVLQKVLKDEAIKRGYPLQDIQGLTLDKDGNFNLPLWSSANSNRYESMLNAIVSNRLIKMKFPGNSYVVGSEEGFKFQENLEGVDESKIIWTDGWDGTGLKGAVHENGKLKKAQVLVASKFKNSNGELIDLFTKEGGEYKYITKTEKGFMLKQDMFDKELLELTSFRIPSSGHQSASQIEIVGFLPHTSADLMIVPKGFTKQKGLDFDIDKENTYQLWNYMDKDGKFKVLTQDHKDEFLLQFDKELRQELESDDTSSEFLKKLGLNPNKPYTEEDIQDNKFLNKKYSQFKEKLLQNEIVKVHRSILSNPSDEVQKKINRVLSTKFAEGQADIIEGFSTSTTEDKYWTPLSDEYQKRKMFLGASGKIGTGAYSLDVVFHSLAQQAAINGTPITLVQEVDGQFIPKTWKFGSYESSHVLGGITTVDGGRTISEVQAERQNIAVDNEKLQVMGRVGLNELTLDVDKVFNMIGLDKGSDGNSISMLFLSQPIIKEYVEKMKNSSSNVADYIDNKEDTIVRQLLEKYDKESKEVDDEYWDTMSKLMSNDNLISGIKSNGGDGKLQAAVLRRFMEMKKYGEALRGVQAAINTDSKGLGKSFFDVIEKRNAINSLGTNSFLIEGASALIGDYISKKNNATKPEGYTDIGYYYVKPTTLTGAFSVLAVSTAYNLWSKYFPYDAAVTNEAFKEIFKIIAKDDLNDNKIIELKQNIFQNIKKYGSASKFTGIIHGHDDINEERKRLYIDSDTNTSLATYLKALKSRPFEGAEKAVVDTFIKTNKLINRFEFDINKNGQPSLIKFNNAAGEEFDEQYLYEALAVLMEVRGKDGRVKLPKIGNKEYTLDTLAQDLIAYSYLGNSVQEAIQFTKYVPVSYLNAVGYSRTMKNATLMFRDRPEVLGMKIKTGHQVEGKDHFISEFTMQYIQHNPERVASPWKWDMKSMASKIIPIDENSFNLKGHGKPNFISVYDSSIPKGEKKFRLYWFDGSKYTRIPVLGTFGMDEYQPRNEIGKSLVNNRVKLTHEPQAQHSSTPEEMPTTHFGVGTGTVRQVFESVANGQNSFSPLVQKLLPYLDETIQIHTRDMTHRGEYDPTSNIIWLSDKILNNANTLADTLTHELVHALTFRQISPYVIKSGPDVELSADAPPHVSNLVRIYNAVKNTVDQDKLNDVLSRVKFGQLRTEERQQFYGLTNIHEFMAMGLTSKEFQDYLNTIPYNGTGQTLLDKFKEFVADVLKAMGVKFDPNFTAAHAISNIFEIIQQENPEDFNPYQTFYDDNINSDNMDDYNDSGISEFMGSVDEFPSRNLTITSESCN